MDLGTIWDPDSLPLSVDFGNQVGASWPMLGAMLAQVGSKMGFWRLFWDYIGTFEAQVGSHMARLPNISPKVSNDMPKDAQHSFHILDVGKSFLVVKFKAKLAKNR